MTENQRFMQIVTRKLALLQHADSREHLMQLAGDFAKNAPTKAMAEFANTLREIADYVEHGKVPLDHYPSGKIE